MLLVVAGQAIVCSGGQEALLAAVLGEPHALGLVLTALTALTAELTLAPHNLVMSAPILLQEASSTDAHKQAGQPAEMIGQLPAASRLAAREGASNLRVLAGSTPRGTVAHAGATRRWVNVDDAQRAIRAL
ncbi:hypothetical protein [Streptomyces ipomoeae]|uniref:hypothetical protein n=1 Tax=Streptomyces ipomoeae TaxID=103232 RepID=UPI001146E655|nr:hypothetical protein [Streptomyces ipomoeae]MDX2939628.1 hypothetical protein [Streptomyces ipomoeae]TQE31947.1 hypothetical protein SipoB123_00495 [Streptomyces ipomoeae]